MQQFFFVKPSLSYVKIQHSMVKIQLQNPNQTSVSKSWPKLKMLTNLLPQNFDLSSASKSWANFSFNIVTKKSRNGDTLSPVELIVWPEQGNQGDQREQDDQGELRYLSSIWNE